MSLHQPALLLPLLPYHLYSQQIQKENGIFIIQHPDPEDKLILKADGEQEPIWTTGGEVRQLEI